MQCTIGLSEISQSVVCMVGFTSSRVLSALIWCIIRKETPIFMDTWNLDIHIILRDIPTAILISLSLSHLPFAYPTIGSWGCLFDHPWRMPMNHSPLLGIHLNGPQIWIKLSLLSFLLILGCIFFTKKYLCWFVESFAIC